MSEHSYLDSTVEEAVVLSGSIEQPLGRQEGHAHARIPARVGPVVVARHSNNISRGYSQVQVIIS